MYLAHHALVLALPFVLPVFIVVGTVAVVAYRDRHRVHEDDMHEDEQTEPGDQGSATAGAVARREGERA